MKKMMLSGLVLLTAAMGSVAQASPATTASTPALPVVAGATALSKSEKAGVNGKAVYVSVYNSVYATGFAIVGVATSVNFGHHNRYR